MNNVYYVYVHRRGDSNEVFYVGKGTGKRAKSKRDRNNWWHNVVKKHGYSIEFIELGLNEDDALDLEVETIKFYRENGHKLCNLTDGGDGISGYRHSEETRAKMSAVKNTEEAKNHVVRTRGRKVLCSNGMIFDSGRKASEWLKIETGCSTNVPECCNRRASQKGGFVWRWLDDCDDLRAVMEVGGDAYEVFGGANKSKFFSPIPVECICTGELFPSSSAAARWLISLGYLKAVSNQVANCCKGRFQSAYGYKFRYIQ